MNPAGPPFFAGQAGAGDASDRGASLFLVAGPCVLEAADLNLEVADTVATVASKYGLRAAFKASFDKANRSSVESPRGPGLEPGLAELARLRSETGLPVLTDIHAPEQAAAAAEVVDLLQIPAFLCRQTDLLVAAAETGRPINVKKGQWMAPEDVAGIAGKLRSAGATDFAVTERGTSFGYGRWIVDMRSFAVMREVAGCPTIFDASHSVQLPGGARSGGEPEHIESLAGAAVAAGADGLFVEVHPNPEAAASDGANVLPLERLDAVVARAVRVREALRG